MDQQSQPIRLSNPCPMLLARMKKADSGYYCKACTTVVIDYSNKSIEEIIATFQPGTCGIFSADHVQPKPSMPFKRRFLFYGLTLLSFFGFNVKPLQSQTTLTKKDSSSISITPKAIVISDSDTVKSTTATNVKKKDIRKRYKRRGIFHRRRRLIGCPDF